MATADYERLAAERLRAVGQRMTANRRTVVAVLANTDRPLTIAEILERAGDLAQSSAYRNLVLLEQTGVAHRVAGHDEFTRYELAEALTGHHHHLVCTHCGRVEDVPSSTELEDSLAAAVDAAARASGFEIEHHRLDLMGRCRRCVSVRR